MLPIQQCHSLFVCYVLL
uniref:Uncharacterized protein n=1 Tax=Anguilla anguilla TaxID=7936 RepID=A0A0E9SGD4_ANGAN